MELLRENEEIALKKILDEKKEPVLVNSKNYIKIEIDTLIEYNYLSIAANADTLNGFGYLVNVTEKGKHYFEDKKIFLQQEIKLKKKERNDKIVGWVRWGITTAIALVALLLSIFLG